jgi:hypothetical protein
MMAQLTPTESRGKVASILDRYPKEGDLAWNWLARAYSWSTKIDFSFAGWRAH